MRLALSCDAIDVFLSEFARPFASAFVMDMPWILPVDCDPRAESGSVLPEITPILLVIIAIRTEMFVDSKLHGIDLVQNDPEQFCPDRMFLGQGGTDRSSRGLSPCDNKNEGVDRGRHP